MATLTCNRCRRVNPAEASYCYFDGVPLTPGPADRAATVGSKATFSREFVFPSGKRSRSFDELAVGLVEDLSVASDLLRGGWLENFFRHLGRLDLAEAARQAAQFPDPIRAVDLLLDRLPTQVLAPARLQVEPLNVHLGQLPAGKDHRTSIHLVNQGVRLLYGSLVVVDTPWLLLGDPPGVPVKAFDCPHEIDIPVLICGEKLRAAKDTQTGRIVVESNGGSVEIVLRVEVPIKPFPHGVLAGARSQRQLAEQAYKQPKEAAPLFESGAVARWYAENNWVYPVQGPTASGLGGVQQFFEACGLAKPPRVELKTKEIKVRGGIGARLAGQVRLQAVDKRPIFAYAFCDQSWVKIDRAELSGTRATIPVVIQVPSAPPNVQPTARLVVISNGRQRFEVPITVTIDRTKPPIVVPADETPKPSDLPPLASVVPPQAQSIESEEGDYSQRQPGRTPPWMHGLPALLLLCVLTGIGFADLLRPSASSARNGLSAPANYSENDPTVYLLVQSTDFDAHRFGISLRGEKRGTIKQLTFDPFGRTNNTIVRIDGSELFFGLQGRPGSGQRNPQRPDEVEPGKRWRSVWLFPGSIEAIQDVAVHRSDLTGRYEVCLIRYTVTNRDDGPHSVGLRFMLDTLIGNNDGVPFTIPGESGLCDTMRYFGRPEDIPDFIQALENGDLKNPGTVANVIFRVVDAEKQIEPPTRVMLCAWPNQALGVPGALGSLTRWDVPMLPIRALPDRPDSAVILYWDERPLEPGQSRVMAFAYGLGRVASTGLSAGQLALTANGVFRPGGEITITAYVADPQPNQTIRLKLPPGLRLVEGQQETKPVIRSQVGSYSPVTWRIRAERTGTFRVSVETGNLSQSEDIVIRAKSFLD
ncbi:MAG: hypothetical protein NZM31_10250 [Gemmatales bacterium]|nr:hypothetical protein [Gemmatales bacterium]MDW8387377.1 hypothetical protein [Gemmatales bacterium]